VLLETPRAVVALDGASWQNVQQDVLFSDQRYQLGSAGKALRSLTSKVLPVVGAKVQDYRLTTRGTSPMELAAADSLEDIEADAELLRRCLVGATAEGAVPEAVLSCLQQAATQLGADRAHETGDAGSTPTAVVQWAVPELLDKLEPWAATLLNNADRMRYVCYALKIASTLGAEGATGGFAGEEVLSLTFAGVDALLVSSWMSWFLKSLTDDSVASNVIKDVVALDFVGGPEAVQHRADAICQRMSADDVEHVTKLAMILKRRISVVVGDIVALMVPNDASLSGAIVTELLIRLKPVDASDALVRLMGWYAMIPGSNRASLESREQLHSLLESSNARLRDAILQEYDKPATEKLKGAAKRSAGLVGANCVLGLTPLGPILGAMTVANFAGSAAAYANTGREACASVFATLEERLPTVVAMLQQILGLSFGVLVLLARCADQAEKGRLKSR